MKVKSLKGLAVILVVALVSLALTLPALAQEKKKEKSDKVWGTLVTAPSDPSGKIAPVALETQKKEVVPLANNAVAKKLQKMMGKKVEIEGKLKEANGKKVLEPWIFVQKDRPDVPTKKPKADAG